IRISKQSILFSISVNLKSLKVGDESEDIVATINVYPNPAANDFTLSVKLEGANEQACNITMTNILGQQIFEKTTTLSAGSLAENIALPDELRCGLYVVTVRINGVTYNQRLMVVK